ncbi:hypothetical protein K1I93_05915 [Streptococcus australis]|uniref:hypothetical protein n=1 Tax=Streptococcus australis TaxID=113107 RepID=UPI001CBD3A29|nr:hypothetical protein [Streptococcus australis]MBZ2159610.1 hypothetical protein [Streptococcus australis]
MDPIKKTLQIENLEIKISNDSSVPHVILNGVDFQTEDIGLKGVNIVWETSKDEVPKTLIQIDYINGRERPQEISIKQSFPNTLLK